MNLCLRDVRLALSDMHTLTEFIEFDLTEYIHRRSPEHRLADCEQTRYAAKNQAGSTLR